MDQIEYLESERKKLWSNIVELRDLIEKRSAAFRAGRTTFSSSGFPFLSLLSIFALRDTAPKRKQQYAHSIVS